MRTSVIIQAVTVGKNIQPFPGGIEIGHWRGKGNPFQSSVAFHVETSHLICSTNQMTGFYMTSNTRLKWVNAKSNS